MIQKFLIWVQGHLQANKNRFAGKETSFLITGLMVLLTGGILAYLISRQKEVLLEYSWEIDILSLIKAAGIYSLCVIIAAIIWNWIITQFSGSGNRRSHLLNYIITNPAKRLPGSLWYIAGRGLLYKKEDISVKMISIVSGIEHIMILLAGFFISIIFGLSALLDQMSPLLLSVIILILLALIQPKVITSIFHFFKVEMHDIKFSNIVLWLVAYMGLWMLGGCAYYFLINAFFRTQIDNLVYVISSWTITGFISSLLILFPSNFGVAEISLSLFLSQILPSSIAVVIVIAGRILYTLLDVLWGLIAMLIDSTKRRK